MRLLKMMSRRFSSTSTCSSLPSSGIDRRNSRLSGTVLLYLLYARESIALALYVFITNFISPDSTHDRSTMSLTSFNSKSLLVRMASMNIAFSSGA